MPELTPERLCEIEARCEAAKTDGLNGKPGVSIDHAIKSASDISDLVAALKQAREERDGYAAALQNARDAFSDQAKEETWAEVGNPGLTKLLRSRAKEFLMATADPAECLNARDAEKDRQIALLTKTIDSLATYEPLPGTPKRQADSQEKAE